MRKTYQQRKALGLILSAEDKREGDRIVKMIKGRTLTTMQDDGWQRADRTPALSAYVANQVLGNNGATPAGQLEQFYRFGECMPPIPRGGKVWVRPQEWQLRGPHGEYVGLGRHYSAAFVLEHEALTFGPLDNQTIKRAFFEALLGPLTIVSL